MEEAPENGKESSHSARANGMNENMYVCVCVTLHEFKHSHYTVSHVVWFVKDVE